MANAYNAYNSYNIHWNGGTPFVVKDVSEDNLVHVTNEDEEDEEVNIVLEYDNFYPGKDGDEDQYVGNTCLLVKNNKYTFIGRKVISFSLQDNDTFVKFCSPLGNSDVPYPYIIGKKYVYLLTVDRSDIIALPTSTIYQDENYSTDPYAILYEDEDAEDNALVVPTKCLYWNSDW